MASGSRSTGRIVLRPRALESQDAESAAPSLATRIRTRGVASTISSVYLDSAGPVPCYATSLANQQVQTMKRNPRRAKAARYELFAVHVGAIVFADFIIRLLVIAYH